MQSNAQYGSYVREAEFPTIWCAGCGHGIIVKAALRAVAKMGLQKDEVIAVSGIGCSARAPAYCDFNSIQTTHGRAIAFATGMKLHRPGMHVLLFLGDGDCAAIGGNHFIHAARRNIDLTVIIMNNLIYGMTGGQGSPTTPCGGYSTTTPFGNIEPQMDLCEVAKASGATYVARTTAYHVNQLAALIEQGMKHKGFSVIECIDPCPTGFGRRNKLRSPSAMYEWLRDAAVPVEKVREMPEEELAKKIVTGVLQNAEKPEYTEEYGKVLEQLAKKGGVEEEALEMLPSPAGSSQLEQFEIRLSGSGGQGLILAGIMLAEAAIMAGKNAVQAQSYGTEARGGASRSEVILSDKEINFPEVISPDMLLAMTQQSCNKFSGTVKPGAFVLLDSTFVESVPQVEANVYSIPITKMAIDQFNNAMVANVIALGILARHTGVVSLEALQSAVTNRVAAGVRETNLQALQAGYDLDINPGRIKE